MTYVRADVVEVSAWGSLVGAVALDPDTGFYAFAYTPGWIETGIELAPLVMPLATTPYEARSLSPETFFRLPAMLADALPDAFGNALVDRWMADQGVPPDSITPLDRLTYAADRSIGALEFRPPARLSDNDPVTAVLLADLVQAARSTIHGDLGSASTASDALRQLISVGTSAGGARAKAVVAFNPSSFQVHSAYEPLLDGFEQWLIKLDGVGNMGMDGHGNNLGDSAPYGRIEYAYYLLASLAGIEMSPCILLAEGPRRHFMTRRFDRTAEGGKLHLASLCALAELDFKFIGAHSYDQLFHVVSRLELGHDAMAEAYRRMVFNVAAANHDDHSKNFAFLCDPEGRWSLAPAFDMTHAYRSDSIWTSRHLLSVNDRFIDVTIDDLYVVGERNKIPGYRRIVRQVLGAVDRWGEVAETAEVPGDFISSIAADLHRFRPS